MDYRTIAKNAGINFAAISFTEQNKLINALHNAHSAGYVSGYSAAIAAPSATHGI